MNDAFSGHFFLPLSLALPASCYQPGYISAGLSEALSLQSDCVSFGHSWMVQNRCYTQMQANQSPRYRDLGEGSWSWRWLRGESEREWVRAIFLWVLRLLNKAVDGQVGSQCIWKTERNKWEGTQSDAQLNKEENLLCDSTLSFQFVLQAWLLVPVRHVFNLIIHLPILLQ